MHVQNIPERLSGPVKVHIVAFPKDQRLRDVDNYCKPILDLLEAAVLEDDRQVTVLHVERQPATGEPHVVHIHVSTLQHLPTAKADI